jgi:hypothetical protein
VSRHALKVEMAIQYGCLCGYGFIRKPQTITLIKIKEEEEEEEEEEGLTLGLSFRFTYECATNDKG